MSKKRKTKRTNKNSYNNNNNVGVAIIHGEKLIYTNSVVSLDGMKPDKRTCIYYDKNNKKCNNKKCSKITCITARNCTGYKRKEKEIKKTLSLYDDTYIQQPYKIGIHETDNRYISMSKNIGTPVHDEYLKNNGHRRHKARWVYYDKSKKLCTWLISKCIGSSHCNKYKEK